MNGKVISGPAAILILFLFFLPWVAASCDGVPKSEFSGFELAVDTELNGDPIFFVVPLAALTSLILLASTLWKPSWETKANWGLVLASIAGLLIFVLKWVQLRGQNNSAIAVTGLPGLWFTVAALLGIGLGAAFDLLRTPKQQSVSATANDGRIQPRANPIHSAPITPHHPPPQSEANNYTWVDDGSFPVDPNLTVVDDDSLPVDPNLTVVDDGSLPVEPNLTVVDDGSLPDEPILTVVEEDDPPAAFQAKQTLLDEDMAEMGHPLFRAGNEDDEDEQVTRISVMSSGLVEPTEVMHIEPKTVAWLVIGNGDQEGEKFLLSADTTIGRDPNSDIFINDTTLSALHVRVRLEDGRFIAYDQNSTNGLYVFNAPQNDWEKQEQVLLQEGMLIKLGRVDLHFITLTLGN